MLSVEKDHIAIFGKSPFECLQLILYGWFRNLKMMIILPWIPSNVMNILKHIFFIERYIKESIKEYKVGLGNYKGLWYEVNQESIDLTSKFYNRQIRNKIELINYYSTILNTNKFETYIKKKFSNQIFALLKDLHIVRLSNIKQNKILMSKNPINNFVVNHMENKYMASYQIIWLSSSWHLFYLCAYYSWLFKQFICRGVTFNKNRKKYKISKEANWNFYRRTLRDDILIDNNRFQINDILMLEVEPQNLIRKKAFEEAKKRGFETASLPKLKININRNIFNIFFFYFLIPLKSFFQLSLEQESYFFNYIFSFHRECFPVELLMNLYDIKHNISTIDSDDVSNTIILNKYNSKNIIFHWTDLTSFKGYNHAFIAHNIFFAWGNIHYNYKADNYFVDKKVNVGCIFKSEFRKATGNKENIIVQIDPVRRKGNIVTFFDTTFSNSIHYTEGFFLEYLEIIKEFCKRNKNIYILLKPKYEEKYERRISPENHNKYMRIWSELIKYDNFSYLNPLKWHIEKVIAISDVCVSMGMNSPSTIALICGKNALYFDNTGNIYHPFAKKYKNSIVFDERDSLFEQINNILNKKFKCQDVINEKEIREYDAFTDDYAFKRVRENLQLKMEQKKF